MSAPMPALPTMMTSLRTGEDSLEIIDQLLLPHKIEYVKVETVEDAFEAIKTMKIRGAPAIASLAALTLSLILKRRLASPSAPTTTTSPTATAYSVPPLTSPSDLLAWLHPSLAYLLSSRPTAVNLSQALTRISTAAEGFVPAQVGGSYADQAKEMAEMLVGVCDSVEREDLERNREMGRIGAEWIWGKRKEGKKGLKVLTVCNTGSLATSGYGTALGVITSLFETGRLEKAYYTQSTPYHQGSRLTSLELSTLQIPSCMICDTMVGALMQSEDIDLVVVGADRVVLNGDTANKIGTYQAATLASRHSIPFMVICPTTTLDLSLPTGASIHIELRPPIEATQVRGVSLTTGELDVVSITPKGVGSGAEKWQEVWNPSFDVTPGELVGCVVTEKGVAENVEGKIDLSGIC